jgi:hypothetical protein
MKTVKQTAAATKKAPKLPKNSDQERLKSFSRQLDRCFPKVSLRQVLGEKLAYDLLMHAQLISSATREDEYQPCVQFVAMQSVETELRGMEDDRANLIWNAREWDDYSRRLRKGGAR